MKKREVRVLPLFFPRVRKIEQKSEPFQHKLISSGISITLG